jgi:tRNA nucleotidyltransferase/poly(A) polymerase
MAQRRLDAKWLREGALPRLLEVLDHGGEEARAVGGAVRNALLGMPVHEIDIATTAQPQEVVKRVTAAGFRPVPTGIEHGTVTVVIDGAPFEVTTLRTDIETYGRHARVAFGRDWKVDAERRDFTINAFSASRDGMVHDYVDGFPDLEARRIRFIGDARKRIEEDYLRVLRFFRFHAAYGRGALDAEGLHACIEARGGLEQLSRERVRMEIVKLLAAPGASAVLQAMTDAGILGPLIAGVPNGVHFTAMAAAETALALPADAMRRLAALAVLVAEDAERLSQRLRLSNAEYARLAAMAEGWRKMSPALSELQQRALLYRLGAEIFTDQALLGFARSGAKPEDPDWHRLATLPQRWQPPTFPIKAADLMTRGVEKGPRLGAALNAAETAWIAAGFPADPKDIARIADAAARS